MRIKPILGILFALAIAPGTALAQSSGDNSSSNSNDNSSNKDKDNNPGNYPPVAPTSVPPISTNQDVETGQPLPVPQSTNQPNPPVASPGAPAGMIIKQAGIGGPTGYGRAGVLELGGSAGLTASNDFTSVNVTPEVGWFVADNMQLSARLGYTYARTKDSAGMINSGSLTSAIIEPSYHLPFNRTTFGFVGVGAGAAYVSGGPGFGQAVAPRIGANFLVGRSGVLTPALSWQYTTHNATMVGPNATLLEVSQAIMANIGYTVMW
jgi:hypothetical protein